MLETKFSKMVLRPFFFLVLYYHSTYPLGVACEIWEKFYKCPEEIEEDVASKKKKGAQKGYGEHERQDTYHRHGITSLPPFARGKEVNWLLDG